jgi:hypothetical protein
VGVNVSISFLNCAASLLNCKIGSIPFTYLGLPVDANSRKASTWEPVVKAIEKRLISWKNHYVSLGGRVVLLNSMLASIPIFYLSFVKLLVSVRKTIIRLQRNYLWTRLSGAGCKISWVSWNDVCRPKNEGGLGVRDLKLFNVSLLEKWRWRLLVGGDSLWNDV